MRLVVFFFSLYLAMDHVPTCMYLMSEPNKQIKKNKINFVQLS